MLLIKNEKIGKKMHFLVSAVFVRNFSDKHHYVLLKFLRTFCFCPKLLFPKLFVLKVDVLSTSSRILLNHDYKQSSRFYISL